MARDREVILRMGHVQGENEKQIFAMGGMPLHALHEFGGVSQIEVGNYGWIKDSFKGKEVFVVGCGPSLEGFDFNRLRGKNVVAINRAILPQYAPFADWWVFLDPPCYRNPDANNPNYQIDPYSLKCKVIAGPAAGLTPRKNVAVPPGRKQSMGELGQFSLTNSAVLALNCVLWAGASMIYLLGIDCTWHKGKSHFHNDRFPHPRSRKPENEQIYHRMAGKFRCFLPYARQIINLSPISKVRYFQKANVDDFLPIEICEPAFLDGIRYQY